MPACRPTEPVAPLAALGGHSLRRKALAVSVMVVGLALLGAIPQAHADVLPERGTWAHTLLARDLDHNTANGPEAYYDTQLNITWLADANQALTSGFDSDGKMQWSKAQQWAAGLNVGGVTGWRLPTAVDTGSPGCSSQTTFSGGDCYFNIDTQLSELAHLFYVTLGNLAQFDTSGESQADFGLVNTGPFSQIKKSLYWTGTDDQSQTGRAFYFQMQFGYQLTDTKTGNSNFAWAVHPGDVAAAPVPEPRSGALALAALGLCALLSRRTHPQA